MRRGTRERSLLKTSEGKRDGFFLHSSTGRVAIHHQSPLLLSEPALDLENIAQTAAEVEPLLSPSICDQRMPPLHAVMYVAQGTVYCLFGKEEAPSTTVSSVCRYLLVAWEQGSFTPGPTFPYTYEQVIAELQRSLPGNFMSEG